MKLHSIRMHNIKSLIGTHVLNLDERFGASELFLIHGPTGIGKTAVFDAVALSLFGQTPQLKSGAKGDNVDSVAWVMNELSGECWTELIFSILEPEGQREYYHARWELHRAGRKPSGAVQSPRRKLNRIDKDGNLLEVMTDSSTVKEVSGAFDKALRGMSYNDFQQTILLPQNGFTRFIQANNNDRVALLERITGTGHLAELCLHAKVKHADYKKELQEEQAQLIGVMNATEVATARQTLLKYQKEEEAYRVSQSIIRLGEEWEHQKGLLDIRRRNYHEKERKIHELINDIASQKKNLEELRIEGKVIQQDLRVLQDNRPVIDEELRQLSERLNGLGMKKSQLIKLQQQIEKQGKEIAKIERQLKKVTGVSQEELETAKQDQESALAELIGRVGDASLSDYAVQVSRRQRFLRRQSEMCRNFVFSWEAKHELEKSIREMRSDLLQKDQEIQKNVQELKSVESEVGQAEQNLIGIRQRLDKAKSFFVFHEERVKLKDGEKCVLCGGTSHPYKTMTDPDKYQKAVDAQAMLKEDAEKVERFVKDRNARFTSLKTSNMHIHRIQKELSTKLSRMEDNLQRKIQEIEQLSIDLGGQPNSFTKQSAIELRGKLESQCDQLDALGQRLNQATALLNTMLQNQNQHQDLLNQKHALLLQQDDLGDQCTQITNEMNDAATDINEVLDGIGDKVNQITKSKCASKDKLSVRVGFLQSHLQATWMKWHGLLNDWKQRETKFEERLNHNQGLKENLEAELRNFQKDEGLLQEKISEAQDRLVKGLQDMETLSIQWFDMGADWTEQWNALKEARQDVMHAKARVEQAMVGIQARLKQYEENLERMKRIQQLENLVEQWKDMHTLLNTNGHVVADPSIGRGMTFRTYAQIRQLQLLVHSANEHLSAMQTDYLLEIRRDGDGRPVLDFEVKMESNFSRPLTTLSGGQTFLVSLAFALALSDLRKVNIHIETLLIDEGFGALDRNYVEMAVDTLELLKHRGVQVGLISHVVALQEKIATSVTIEDLKFVELGAESHSVDGIDRPSMDASIQSGDSEDSVEAESL